MQLQHDDEETGWQDHGHVKVVLADGTVIATEPHAQHNRNYGAIPATMQKMADTAVRALKAGLGKAGAPAPKAPAAAKPASAQGGIALAANIAAGKVTTGVAAAAN